MTYRIMLLVELTKPGEGLEELRKSASVKPPESSSAEPDILSDQELRILEKIREVAKSQEEFDALVEKYLKPLREKSQ